MLTPSTTLSNTLGWPFKVTSASRTEILHKLACFIITNDKSPVGRIGLASCALKSPILSRKRRLNKVE